MIDFERRIFKFHEFQERAWDSSKRIIALISGIQGGKSVFGAAWLRKQVRLNRDPGVAFLVCVPDYPNLYQGALIPWKRMNADLGIYNEQKNIFRLWDGRVVYFRSGEKPDSVESVPNVAAIWCDEAGKYRREFWQNIRARSAKMGAQILLTTTPYGRNWLWKDVVSPAQRGMAPDVELIVFDSIANPSFPKDEFDKMQTVLSPAVFARKFQGQFTRMEGLVYPDFDPESMVIEPVPLSGAKYYGGIDWGFSSPFAVTVRAIDEYGDHYCVSEFLRSGLTPEEKIQVVRSKLSQYPVDVFYADSEAPDMITAFCNAGIPTVGVKKGKDSVMHGIELHTELIRTDKYRVFHTCKNVLEEYETYAYPEVDEDDAREMKPLPLNNHLMDAERYITLNTFQSEFSKHKVYGETLPGRMTVKKRIDWLKRGGSSKQLSWVDL